MPEAAVPIFTVTVQTVLSFVVALVMEEPETPVWTRAKSSASIAKTGSLNVAVKWTVLPGSTLSWSARTIETTVGNLIL